MTAAGIDELLGTFGVEPRELQALDPAHPRFDAQRALLVLPPQFAAARPLLAGRYPAAHEARAALAGGAAPSTVATLPADARAWLIAPLAPEADLRSLAGLRAVMERLYGPDGCPWDREQTHESLREYLLEETYEVVDAIDRGDVDGLREELGDLLAHVFMHTSMAQERGEFSVEDVVEGIAAKMVRRHPHVFGDEDAGSEEQLLDRWEEIKAEERAAADGGAERPERGALDSVPLAAPALQRSQSLQSRAARAGALEPELPALQAVARRHRCARRLRRGGERRTAAVGGRALRQRHRRRQRRGAARRGRRVHRQFRRARASGARGGGADRVARPGAASLGVAGGRPRRPRQQSARAVEIQAPRGTIGDAVHSQIHSGVHS